MISITTNNSILISIDKKGIPIKKIPFAGVGKPKKQDLDGRELNLASLIIENGTIKINKKGKKSNSLDLLCRKSKIKKDGTKENVIKSERESN